MHPEYRAQWVAAGYPRHMGSAEVVPPPAGEFIRAYHFTSTEFAMSDIALGRIKVARFYDLNDPFELKAVSFLHKNVRKAASDFAYSYATQWGLVCFSANWTNPVLWSHYSEKHGGICLGFDVRRNQIEQVEYTQDRLQLEDTDDPSALINKEQQKRLLRTKFSHWSYEEEFRIHVPLKNAHQEGVLHFLPFSADLALTEVILGIACQLSVLTVQQQIKKLYSNVVTFKARPANKSFGVVPLEATVP